MDSIKEHLDMKRKRGRPRCEKLKVRIKFRAYPEQLPSIKALVDGAVDPEKAGLVLKVAELLKEMERMKRTNYDLATQNAKLLEEVEGYKAIIG